MDRELIDAVLDFLASSFVELPHAPDDMAAGEIWWEKRDGWLYPWRMTGPKTGYPCGEPRMVDSPESRG